MADLELSGGLQAVINGVNAKTGSGYADTDLIQLYANDGTPNGKIARSALMSCVKDSLGTLLNQRAADLGTSLAKIPALNSGGTLGSATVANLASVLEVPAYGARQGATYDANTPLRTTSKITIDSTEGGGKRPQNLPSDIDFGNLLTFSPRDTQSSQFAVDANSLYVRFRDGANFYDWRSITTDMPSFYKNYADLNALGSALNVGTLKSYVSRSNGSAYIYIKIKSGYNSALISLTGQFAVSKPQIINLYFMSSTVYSATGYIYESAKVYFRTEGSAGVFYIGNASLTCTMLCYSGTIDERVVEAGVVSSLPSGVVEVPVS